MENNMNKDYESGWKDGFTSALKVVLDAIDRNRNEAERDGDEEYLDENSAGWSDVENIIDEAKEHYLST